MVLEVVVVWVVAYVVTNVDDLVLLALFFAHSEFSARNVVIGEYVGIGTILLLSVLGALGTSFVPQAWIGLLGVVPISIGVRYLRRDGSLVPTADEPPLSTRVEGSSAVTSVPTRLLPRDLYVVWLVTVANSADNFAVYLPLFRSQGFAHLWAVGGVFAVMIGAWCALAKYTQDRSSVRRFLHRYEDYLLPYTLIGLGLYILATSGSIGLVIEVVGSPR
jgi:cadmium resistance protein CadD (predicted permease)